jgi:hypothetical protein
MADIESNEELADLLKAVSEYRLSPEQHERLEAILRDDPDARKQYLRYVHADALLSWRYAPVLDQPADLDAGDEVPEIIAAPPDRRNEEGKPVTPKPTTTARKHSRFWWVSGIGVAIAASLMLAALLSRSTQAITVLKGEAVCTSCVLHESHEHAPALRVIAGPSTNIYYLDRSPDIAALQGYFCNGPTAATAEGKARKEDGRRLFQAATVTIHEANRPDEQSRDAVSTILPK